MPPRLFHWTIERTAAQHTRSRATRLHACDDSGAAVPLRYDYDAMKRNRCGPQRANVLTRVVSPITLPRRGAESYCMQPHTRQPNRCRRAATAAREASGERRGAARLGSGHRAAAGRGRGPAICCGATLRTRRPRHNAALAAQAPRGRGRTGCAAVWPHPRHAWEARRSHRSPPSVRLC